MKDSILKVGVHITFYFSEERLQYLKDVINSMSTLSAEVQIFVYTNRSLEKWIEYRSNIEVRVFDYRNYGKAKLSGPFDIAWLKRFAHPYYLSWENRRVIEQYVDDF